MNYEDGPEDLVWKTLDPNDMWALDKLILGKKLGYTCGPTGIVVPAAGWYIVRPCVNALGLGLGAQRVWLEEDTCHLPIGHFWCEWFDGRHLSIDYQFGKQHLCVEGHKSKDTFTKWDKWIRTKDIIPLPFELQIFSHYQWLNVEYINGKVIELHFRHNEDFEGDIQEFVPVWEGQSTAPPRGYTYRDYPDVHGRIGAFVK